MASAQQNRAKLDAIVEIVRYLPEHAGTCSNRLPVPILVPDATHPRTGRSQKLRGCERAAVVEHADQELSHLLFSLRPTPTRIFSGGAAGGAADGAVTGFTGSDSSTLETHLFQVANVLRSVTANSRARMVAYLEP